MATASGIRAGQAYIELSLSDDKFKKSLQNAERRLQSVGKSIALAGTKIAAFGAAGLSAFVPAIKAASDFQETMSKFETVFRDASDRVEEFGESLASELGRSKTEILQFLASSQDLFVPLGFDAATAEQLSKTITRLSVDLASFNNIADGDALRDLQAALTGSGEVMKKYGVLVSEAAVKQQLFNQGLDPKTATDQEKVLARLSIILAGTTAAQGDATRTADSFANQMKRLQGNLVDVAVSVGQALLPTLTDLVSSVNRITGTLTAWVKDNGELVATLAIAAASVTALGTALVGIGAAVSLAGSPVGAFTTAIGLMGGAATVASVALGALFSPITLILGGMAAVIAVVGGWDAVIGTVRALGDAVGTVAKVIGSAFVALFDEIAPTMTRLLGFVRSGFQTMANVILGIIGQIARAIDVVFRSNLKASIDEAMNRLAQVQADQNAAATTQRASSGAQKVATAASSQADAAESQAKAVADAQAAYSAALKTTTQNQIRSSQEVVGQQEGLVESIAAASQSAALTSETSRSIQKQLEERYADIPVNKSIQVQATTPRELLELQRIQEQFAADQAKAEEERLAKLSGLQGGLETAARQAPSSPQFGGLRAEQVFGGANEQVDIAKKQLDVSRQQLESNKKIEKAVASGGLAFT